MGSDGSCKQLSCLSSIMLKYACVRCICLYWSSYGIAANLAHSSCLTLYAKHQRTYCLVVMKAYVPKLYSMFRYYGRPLSVSGRPCYILPLIFIYLFFLWPPYSPALVNGGSRKFYMWWTLSVFEEVTTWIFSWSSLNYRVGQKVLAYFQTSPANFLLSRPNAAEYCNSEKKTC